MPADAIWQRSDDGFRAMRPTLGVVASVELRGVVGNLAGWMIASLMALVGWEWWGHRHRVPAGAPRCAACGYNLTGNMSGVCPECGTKTGY